MYSYHIFYFPFKWEIPSKKDKLFSEQVNLDDITVLQGSDWQRVRIPKEIDISSLDEKARKDCEDIYGEKNYYFEFVHSALYDEEKRQQDAILHHYERKETKEEKTQVRYIIKTKNKTFVLKIDAINLNLYATGVGILSFFLINDKEDQKKQEDIRLINQFGRRIMPPHYGEVTGKKSMISEEIAITGLRGIESHYSENFSVEKYKVSDAWKPADFICQLIKDLSLDLDVIPVIDDRMFVNCWYGNDDLVKQFKASDPLDNPIEQAKQEKYDEIQLKKFIEGDFWYKYLFVDDGDDESCQNRKMKTELLEKSTYYRWQKCGTLYGVSKYSLVLLAASGTYGFLGRHMQTIYSRMVELMLVQRASMLKFSGEVTKVSRLSEDNQKIIIHKIGSLYKEYIRFVNQIYFREVTAQDQGIELYRMLMDQIDSDKQIKDLDDEINELHDYALLLEDQRRSENSHYLNKLASIFLPATVIASLFGMNAISNLNTDFDGDPVGEIILSNFFLQLLLIIVITFIIYNIIKRK